MKTDTLEMLIRNEGVKAIRIQDPNNTKEWMVIVTSKADTEYYLRTERNSLRLFKSLDTAINFLQRAGWDKRVKVCLPMKGEAVEKVESENKPDLLDDGTYMPFNKLFSNADK